ncbi:hypothetical protein N7527_007835 [Penicillium freii]|nr:hypothetical protein N7527_007835 [Penicillium freii]
MPKSNKEIEIEIQKAIDSLSEQSKPNIAKTAREFAVEKRFFNDNPMVGSSILYKKGLYLKRFLKRYPEYYVRRRRALDVERSAALDKSVVERYLKKKLFNRSVTNRESITVLEAISADGFVCPPLIILSAKQALLRWFNAIKEDKYLAPINPKLITNKLESYDPYLSRSNTLLTISQNTEFSTPKTAEKVRRISLQLNQYDPTTQRFKEGLAKLTKGTKAQATLARQL